MKKIEEILALPDMDAMVHLKSRKTQLPDSNALAKDWYPDRHDVMDIKIRKDGKMVTKEPVKDSAGNITKPAEYETDPVNRIYLPIEQDIVNIHTAFTVGTEPKLNCTPEGDEESLLNILKTISRKNKLKYQNKKIVRAWLSEQDIAEYWFVVEDTSGFWSKLFAKIKQMAGVKGKPEKKLRSMIWSPFLGDTLYPLFDDYGDLIALSREYKTKNLEGREFVNFMTVTATDVITWKEESEWARTSFKHGFKKMPVIYAYRSEPLCKNIKPMRNRLENLMSDYADCIDRYFFPFMLLRGDINGAPLKAGKSRMIKLEGDKADAHYLEWAQSPESVKLEMDNLIEKIYHMTNTPRLSVEKLQGTGNVPSGTAFRYTFMGSHLAVENHAEIIGEFFQRRINFLVSASATLIPKYEAAASTIDIDVEIVPYMIDSLAEKIKTAVEGVSGKVVSRREGIMLVGIADKAEETLKEIQEDEAASIQEPTL